MLYVKRDGEGRIVAVSEVADQGFTEAEGVDEAELRRFLSSAGLVPASLQASDQDFIRVLDDVIQLLIDKRVILFTELPESAQEKVLLRRQLRSELGVALNLIGDD